jgi:phosphate transport system ATP-binding protein
MADGATVEDLSTAPLFPADEVCLDVRDLSVTYGGVRALDGVELCVPRRKVTAFIGPSGCGKTTLLRCFNRMNDLIDDAEVEGSILFEGDDIYGDAVDPYLLRRRVGMVFQKPNPFPKTVYENVAFGLRLAELEERAELDERIEWALRSAALWDEVKDRLHESALSLSGGQQQRLVIARAIAIQPQVLLLDEPASSLDPISTLKIEELIAQLSERYTILIVTHNMQQAARVSNFTAFLYMGDLVEFDATETIFTNPSRSQTEDYITGRYG